MERKSIILIILSVIVVLSLIFLVIYNTKTNLSPLELEECKSLTYNGENKINLVFFSTQNQAEEYSNYLLSTNPFNKNKEAFNIYYIDTYKPRCEIYEEKALLCYNKEMVRKASSCPNDYIVVIEKEDKKIRSSAYMNLISINSKNPLTVLIHEYGHVFANLADEYVPAILPKKSKNCVKDCEDFDVKDGCFEGCAKSEYYRSINNGIMRTLSTTNFGVFDENQILTKIREINKDSKITGKAIESIDCSDQEYCLIQGEYTDNKVSITSKSIEEGCVSNLGSGSLDYTLIHKDNSTITKEFNPKYIFTDAYDYENSEIDGSVFESNKPFFIKIPIDDFKSLNMREDNQTLIEINIEDITTKSRPCKK